jgi:hypothetical protein
VSETDAEYEEMKNVPYLSAVGALMHPAPAPIMTLHGLLVFLLISTQALVCNIGEQ